jgi:hypothetical protein
MRVQFECAPQGGECLVVAACFAERGAEVVVDLGARGHELQRGVKRRDGTVEIVQIREQVAEIVGRGAVVGLQVERDAIGCDRFVVAAELRLGFTQREPRGRETVVRLEQVVAEADDLRRAPESIERKGARAVIVQPLRVERDGPRDPVERGTPVPRAQRQHREIIPRHRIARIAREVLAIRRVRLRVAPRLVMLDRDAQSLGIDHRRTVAVPRPTGQSRIAPPKIRVTLRFGWLTSRPR